MSEQDLLDAQPTLDRIADALQTLQLPDLHMAVIHRVKFLKGQVSRKSFPHAPANELLGLARDLEVLVARKSSEEDHDDRASVQEVADVEAHGRVLGP